ncbi:MAG: hypothetical protein IKU06_11335 [Lachnospiraceae bacterium]|nr:hypothetical protein [Lachnospiraceae bacterium]
MKINKVTTGIIISVLLIMLLGTGRAEAAVNWYTEPDTPWDWADGSVCQISGNTGSATLYSNYYFTNANALSFYIESASGSNYTTMSVKFWKRTAYGKVLVDEFQVVPGGSASKLYNSITYTGIYFFEFSPCANFSGYCAKVY